MNESTGFHTSANFQKEFNSLIGIATGLVADDYITKGELDFFDLWIREQKYADMMPFYNEIMDTLSEAKNDDFMSEYHKERLAELIQLAIENEIVFNKLSTTDDKNITNRLIGVIRVVLADDVLSNVEIESLHNIIASHTNPLFSATNDLLKKIKDFNNITQEQRDALKIELNRIIGGSIHEHGVIDGMTANISFDTLPEEFDLYCKRFVLTGSFYTMSRKQMGTLIESFGATQSRHVNGVTDLLVVGGMASKDWAFSSFGRKIEEAITLREDGNCLLIVNEKQMADYLEGL